MQTYTFVYQRLIDFPQQKLDYETVTSYSKGYAHDFCNMKVTENQNQVTCIVHNFFGFHLSVWGTKDVNIGGTGLTNINFASISTQVKFIDTMKNLLTSLGQLASTLDDVKRKNALKS